MKKLDSCRHTHFVFSEAGRLPLSLSWDSITCSSTFAGMRSWLPGSDVSFPFISLYLAGSMNNIH